MHTVPEKETARIESIPAAFLDSAERFADNVVFKAHGGKGKSYTYQDAAHLVREFSSLLASGYIQQNREIGLLAENRPEWCIAYMAILHAGGTVVPIDANLNEHEIGYIVGHARLRAVICSYRFEEMLKKLPGGLTVISLDEGSGNFWKEIKESRPAPIEEEGSGPSEVAALIYTSGTTGAPKAVQLTHKNLLSNLDGIAASLRFDEHDIFLSILPLHHTFEATCGFLTPLMSGSTVVYARSLKSKEILEDIGYNKVTVMCGVPLLYEKMYHSMMRKIKSASLGKRAMFNSLLTVSAAAWGTGTKPGRLLFRGLRRKAGLGTIRMFVSGGAAIPPRIARFYNLIGFDFLQGYGLTETSPVLSVNRPDKIKFGSVGPPLKGVEVKINEPDAVGVGEILVRGDNITSGYRDNPEATAKLIKDGWLHTGDLGRMRDGHLWITGRKKNLIVSAAGKNIYPEELEERLLDSLYVLEAIVLGRAKEYKQGEEVFATIVPDLEQIAQEHDISIDKPDMLELNRIMAEVVKEVNSRVSDYKRISGFDLKLDEFEKTSTKKVKRFLYQ